MNILRRIQLSRDRRVTIANLVDELLRRNGDRDISIEDDRPYRLAEMHAEMHFCGVRSRCGPASKWRFIAPMTGGAFIGSWRSFAPGASRFR
jgi:hypothetical protein